MISSLLHEKLSASGALLGDYAGAQSVVCFGDAGQELRALLQGCVVYEVPWRAKLVVTGEDRVRWLNGMVTGNVRDLPLNHGTYSFLLNPQGRIQADLVAYNRGDYLLVTTELCQLQKLTETFERYIIMDDVELSDVSASLGSIGLAGLETDSILRRAGFNVGRALQPHEVADTTFRDVGVSLVRGADTGSPEYEIWFHPDNALLLWDALVAAGATPAGWQALEWNRILKGVPRIGIDISERDLPQETGQERALHYAKGCYVGQEIVERIHSRGNVHRQLSGFTLKGAPPARGTRLQLQEKEVGEITSAASIPLPTGERTLALGYVRREFAAPGTELMAAEAIATFTPLPFTI